LIRPADFFRIAAIDLHDYGIAQDMYPVRENGGGYISLCQLSPCIHIPGDQGKMNEKPITSTKQKET
jgi:hypothetical protein